MYIAPMTTVLWAVAEQRWPHATAKAALCTKRDMRAGSCDFQFHGAHSTPDTLTPHLNSAPVLAVSHPLPPYTGVIASDCAGQVHLWDVRAASGMPRWSVGTHTHTHTGTRHGDSAQCLVVSDNHLFAGTRGGRIVVRGTLQAC